MSHYVLSQLADGLLLEALPRIAARDRATTAELLAHLAEVETRRLFAAAGYSSMRAYCVGKLRYSDDAAEKRIHAARVAQAHPVLFEMIADGQMSLTTVRALGPYLGNSDAAELIAAAAGRSRSEIERLIAERYPCSELFEWGTGTAPVHADSGNSPAPGRVGTSDSADSATTLAPSHASSAESPLAGERVALQLVISRATHAKLARAKELLGFAVAANDTEEVLARALDALILALEKRRFGKHTRHRAAAVAAATNDPRHIPSTVREQVAARDAEQCAFVSDDGKRCESRHALEIDHIVPLAQGGATHTDNLRLLCPAHNQYEADRRFGRSDMQQRRQKPLVNHARQRRELPHAADVRAALFALGFGKDEVATALDFAMGLPEAMTASERVKQILRRRGARGPGQERDAGALRRPT